MLKEGINQPFYFSGHCMTSVQCIISSFVVLFQVHCAIFLVAAQLSCTLRAE